jgi:arsenite methyltransferase
MSKYEYLNYSSNWNDPETVSLHDELPLWSAPFGLMLLDRVKLNSNMTVLDIGFGTGFPLIDLAGRLGNSSTVYGIDLWSAAIEVVKRKIKVFGIKNVKLVEGDASAMDFKDNMFDLIVSNLGINNFKNVEAVFRECIRVAKPGGRIALTTNPVGHMQEFYDILAETMSQLKLGHLMDRFESQRQHRISSEKICHNLETVGFVISAVEHDSFSMRFADGSAFLNHYLIKYAFMDGWKDIFPPELVKDVFIRLEANLNALAEVESELKVTIPIVYIEGKKPLY